MKEFKLKITEENSDSYIQDELCNLYEDKNIEYICITNMNNDIEEYKKNINTEELLEKFLWRKYILWLWFPNELSVKDLYDDISYYTDFELEWSEDLNEFARERFNNIMNDLKRRIIYIKSKNYNDELEFYIITKQWLNEEDFDYLKDLLDSKDYTFEYTVTDYIEHNWRIYSSVLQEDWQIFTDIKCEKYMFDTFQSISDSCDKTNIEELKKEYL